MATEAKDETHSSGDSSSGVHSDPLREKRLELRAARRQLVLFRHPLATLYHASCELLLLIRNGIMALLQQRLLSLLLLSGGAATVVLYMTTTNHVRFGGFIYL